MMVLMKKYNLPLLSRFILGAVFIYASLDKIADPIAFSTNIDNYHITPIAINNLAALIIPWVELILGLCLITGVLLDGASILTMALLVFFIFIISQAYVRGISLNCGCFKTAVDPGLGDLRQDMLWRIFEDILFLGLAVIVYFRDVFRRVK
jgi:putative oxidoreductase